MFDAKDKCDLIYRRVSSVCLTRQSGFSTLSAACKRRKLDTYESARSSALFFFLFYLFFSFQAFCSDESLVFGLFSARVCVRVCLTVCLAMKVELRRHNVCVNSNFTLVHTCVTMCVSESWLSCLRIVQTHTDCTYSFLSYVPYGTLLVSSLDLPFS